MSIYTPAEQAERVTGGWISVEDRLPEYHTRVLVFGVEDTNETPTIHVASCSIVDWFKDGDSRNGLSWGSSHSWGTTPTHWQPLPAPPEAE